MCASPHIPKVYGIDQIKLLLNYSTMFLLTSERDITSVRRINVILESVLLYLLALGSCNDCGLCAKLNQDQMTTLVMCIITVR